MKSIPVLLLEDRASMDDMINDYLQILKEYSDFDFMHYKKETRIEVKYFTKFLKDDLILLYTLNIQQNVNYVFGMHPDSSKKCTLDFYLICFKCLKENVVWHSNLICKYKNEGDIWYKKTIGIIMNLFNIYYLKNFMDKLIGNYKFFSKQDIENHNKLVRSNNGGLYLKNFSHMIKSSINEVKMLTKSIYEKYTDIFKQILDSTLKQVIFNDKIYYIYKVDEEKSQSDDKQNLYQNINMTQVNSIDDCHPLIRDL